MSLSREARERIIISLTSRAKGKEVADSIDVSATTINALIDAYTALLAKLNADTGVADSNYGTGASTPPKKI